MMTLTIGSWVTNLLTVLFALVSAFMILVILIQKPKGGGLSGAFGGGGGGQGAVFGAKTGDVLTWFTVGFFVVFLLLGMGLVWSTRSDANPTPTPTTQEAPDDTGLPPALGGDSPGEGVINGEGEPGTESTPDVPPPPPPTAEDPTDEPAGEPAPETVPEEPNDAEPNP